MNTYKITNLTNQLGKRDSKYNSVLDINYIDNRTKKVAKLKPGETVFLTVQSLPLSVHRLRIKNIVAIEEISAAEFKKSLQAAKPKKAKKKPVKVSKPKPVAKKETAITTEEMAETPLPPKKPRNYKKKTTE